MALLRLLLCLLALAVPPRAQARSHRHGTKEVLSPPPPLPSPPEPPQPPPPSPEKSTLAAELEKMVEKEFHATEGDAQEGHVFNETLGEGGMEKAKAETVVRVTRSGALVEAEGAVEPAPAAAGGPEAAVAAAAGEEAAALGEAGALPLLSSSDALPVLDVKPSADELRARAAARTHRASPPPPDSVSITASLAASAASAANAVSAAAASLGATAFAAAGVAAGGDESAFDVARLMDSHDNTFVLSMPSGQARMTLYADVQLLTDVTTLLLAATVGGALAVLFGQPGMVGMLLAGSAVGPGGWDVVRELVQVETLSGLGALLMLFGLGLEFSLSKLRAVRGVALGGGALTLMLFTGVAGAAAQLAGADPGEGFFLGALLAQSSTAVVLRCLQERGSMGTLSGQVTVGTLVLQDCTVGLLFAILPSFGKHASSDASDASSVSVAAALFKVALRALAFLAVAAAVARRLLPLLLSWAHARGAELHLLVSLSLALCVAKASDALGLSLEMGAFVAGVAVSAGGGDAAERVLHAMSPVRTLFQSLFLTGIGMLLNGPFLLTHLRALLLCVVLIALAKTAISALVVRAYGYSLRTSLLVGLSLAQVGEFAFVLLSRAQALHLIQRPAYLLLLGTTALSLLFTPLLFKAQSLLEAEPPGTALTRGLSGNREEATVMEGGLGGETETTLYQRTTSGSVPHDVDPPHPQSRSSSPTIARKAS